MRVCKGREGHCKSQEQDERVEECKSSEERRGKGEREGRRADLAFLVPSLFAPLVLSSLLLRHTSTLASNS